ncbi:MAG: glutamine phosphoribosylpyrophosphate amidotransferase [Candidatus Rokuibacteriota bacterium]
MCGIVGFFDQSGASGPLGATLLGMLETLACRGPDSCGVALWGPAVDGLIVRVKLGQGSDADARRTEVVGRAARLGRVQGTTQEGSLLRLVVAKAEPVELAAAIEAIGPDVEVVSIGERLEIVKQVGAPANLEAEFGVSRRPGTHGLGHTRLSTESRVDLSHSQPFWAHGAADLAIVHNGHITNYHKLRRIYEQTGVRFYTENDSEIIGVYLARRLREGLTLREALEASLRDLDGSFSYLAATADAFGFAKDPFCLKPLIVGESGRAVAVANEEMAIQAALPAGYRAREAGARAVAVWEVQTPSRRTRLRARPAGARGRA